MVHFESGLGVVVFRVYLPNATSVHVVGVFTGWEDGALSLSREGDGWWRVAVELPAGDHDFAYLVDGHCWMPDYASNGLRRDGEGRWISTVRVPAVPVGGEDGGVDLSERVDRRGVAVSAARGRSDGVVGDVESVRPGVRVRLKKAPSGVMERGGGGGFVDGERGWCPWPGRDAGGGDGVGSTGAGPRRSAEAEEAFRRIRSAIFGQGGE